MVDCIIPIALYKIDDINVAKLSLSFPLVFFIPILVKSALNVKEKSQTSTI